MAVVKKKRAPARKRVTIKEVDALNKRINELELELKKYEQFSIGIHLDGLLEPVKSYTIFMLEEGARNCLGMAEELKKGVVISPSPKQALEEEVEKTEDIEKQGDA